MSHEVNKAKQYLETGLECFSRDAMIAAACELLNLKPGPKGKRASWDDVQGWIEKNRYRVRDGLSHPLFIRTCREWVTYRQSLPKAKPLQLESLIKTVQRLSSYESVKRNASAVAVEYTIRHGWQGLTPLERIPAEEFDPWGKDDNDILSEVLK